MHRQNVELSMSKYWLERNVRKQKREVKSEKLTVLSLTFLEAGKQSCNKETKPILITARYVHSRMRNPI